MISRNLRTRASVLVPVAALSATAVVVTSAQLHHDDDTAPVSATRAVDPASPTPAPALSLAATPSSAPVAAAPGAVAAPASVTTPNGTSAVGTSVPAALRARPATGGVIAGTTAPVSPTALAAYQRAASVIDQASAGCHLDWQLLAAIGRIESGDGTSGGAALSPAGVATPAIYGPVLDGRHHTQLIADTDSGKLDEDQQFDRAVGPMQILPATWVQIAVDGDGDGRRDPQDINDAALASAVYLCSTGADLSTPEAQRAALLRYNHSDTYATAVLAVATSYVSDTGLTGSAAAVPATFLLPGGVAAAGGTTAAAPAAPDPTRRHHQHHKKKTKKTTKPTDKPTDKPTSKPTDKPTGQPTAPPAPPAPTAPAKAPSAAAAPATADQLADLCRPAIVKAYPDATEQTVDAATDACGKQLTGLTLDQAQAKVDAVVAALPDTVPGLKPEATGTPSETPTADPTDGGSAGASGGASSAGTATAPPTDGAESATP